MFVKTRLSVMMFLEFFIWGAWLPLIFGYLPSMKWEVLKHIEILNTLSQYLGSWIVSEASWVLNAFTLASLVGMFFSNQFADRNFAAEKFVALSHLIGGAAIFGLAFTTSFWPFFGLMLLHSLFYVPTISITNSIAFANLKDPQKDFGIVRLWGTIGWIAASWPFVFILADWTNLPAFGEKPFTEWADALLTSKTGAALQEGTKYTFMVAGLASLVLAAFSLFLPHTPPKKGTGGLVESLAWLKALKFLAIPAVAVLFFATFVDAAVHQCYFIWTNDFLKSVGIRPNLVMPVMSIGQFAEIITMAVLGMVLKRLGWRLTMTIGILGHAVRFAVFSLVPLPWVSVVVIMLHGICYAFFFATVYIFVDEVFPKDSRSSAQGLFNFLILGLGPFVANFLWPYIGEQVKTIDVKAEVRYESGQSPAIVVSGVIKHPAGGQGAVKISQSTKGTSEPQTLPATLDVDGAFSVRYENLAPGEYTHSFQVIRKSWLLGDKEMTAAIPALTVLEEKPQDTSGTSQALRDFDYQKLFLYPSATAAAAALFLLLLFNPPAKPATQ